MLDELLTGKIKVNVRVAMNLGWTESFGRCGRYDSPMFIGMRLILG